MTIREQIRIYVVWHPALPEGEEIAREVIAQFEGMTERVGARPIPVRTLSASADETDLHGPPRPVDPLHAYVSIAIILAEENLVSAFGSNWRGFRDQLVQSLLDEEDDDQEEFILPLIIAADSSGLSILDPGEGEAGAGSWDAPQAERAYDWPHALNAPHGVTKILLHTMSLILRGLELTTPADEAAAFDPAQRHTVFLSHAKADLNRAEAEEGASITERLRERMVDTNYGLDAYFDATHLAAGFGWRRQFRRAIGHASLMVIATDAYASRPVCQWEFLQAKQQRRPVLTVNAVKDGEALSFAYGGNVPTSRMASLSDADVDALLLDLVAEAVRCELWLRDARSAAERARLGSYTLLPRPIELADLAFHALEEQRVAEKTGVAPGSAPHTLLYPDPPLSDDLDRLLKALRPPYIRIMPLSNLLRSA